MTDDEFIATVVRACRGLPNVTAVNLGGSRARGDHRPDSDWDFAVYYRGTLDVTAFEDLGWDGHVYRPFEWGQVMYGGAVFDLDGRHFDIHYRNLDVVEHWTAAANEGRFEVHILGFHLAGIPTYMLTGELAISRTLWGGLPRPEYPPALRERAPGAWIARAEGELGYARYWADSENPINCAGGLARATMQAAHARLAHRGIWALNEKHGAVGRDDRSLRALRLTRPVAARAPRGRWRCRHRGGRGSCRGRAGLAIVEPLRTRREPEGSRRGTHQSYCSTITPAGSTSSLRTCTSNEHRGSAGSAKTLWLRARPVVASTTSAKLRSPANDSVCRRCGSTPATRRCWVARSSSICSGYGRGEGSMALQMTRNFIGTPPSVAGPSGEPWRPLVQDPRLVKRKFGVAPPGPAYCDGVGETSPPGGFMHTMLAMVERGPVTVTATT